MMKITQISFGTIVFFLLLTSSAFAISEEQGIDETTLTIMDYIEDYVDVPEGATDWKIFGETKTINIDTKDEEGFDLSYQKPEFSPEVTALNGQQIIVKGYMFPLEEVEAQALFLFGPFPLSCPFHYHVGPSLVLEVHAEKNPVFFDYEPVVITGTLELVPNDPELSVFYRLKNAKQVQ